MIAFIDIQLQIKIKNLILSGSLRICFPFAIFLYAGQAEISDPPPLGAPVLQYQARDAAKFSGVV
jgi:hypothetical protein